MTSFIHYNQLRDGTGSLSPDPVVVWVPGEAVACHRLTVPPVGRRKWQAMVPWLLEDQLLEAVDRMVLGVGEKESDGGVAVVAASSAQVTDWKATLSRCGQPWRALVPDFFALPWRPGEISLALLDDRCLVRFNRWQGAAGTPELLIPLLKNRLGADEAAVVYYQDEKPEAQLAELDNVSYQHTPSIFSPSHREWLSLTEGEPAGTPTNGATTPALVAAGLAAVLCALLFVSTLVESRRTTAQAAHLETELRGGYQQYFGQPYDFALGDFQRVVSAQLEAGASAGNGGVVPGIRRLSTLLQECGGCRLQGLEAGPGVVTVNIVGDDLGVQLAGATAGDESLTLREMGERWQLTYGEER